MVHVCQNSFEIRANFSKRWYFLNVEVDFKHYFFYVTSSFQLKRILNVPFLYLEKSWSSWPIPENMLFKWIENFPVGKNVLPLYQSKFALRHWTNVSEISKQEKQLGFFQPHVFRNGNSAKSVQFSMSKMIYFVELSIFPT